MTPGLGIDQVHVSVAICTWNRSRLLRETLDQLSRVAVPAEIALEVLIVNNNCTDDTDEVIDGFRERLPISRIFEARPGVAHARNAALGAASGDYVAFLDDDALPDSSWLAALLSAVRAYPSATVIGGVIEPRFMETPDVDLMQAFHWLRHGFCGLDYGRSPGPLPDGLAVYGPNMAFSRLALGGLRFDTSFGGTPTSTMGGDEHDLLDRIRQNGGLVIWWPSMRVRHCIPASRMTLDYCLRFAVDKGRERVLREGISPGPQWFGAPRWLYRRWLVTAVGYAISSMSPVGLPINKRWLSGHAEPRTRRLRTLVWRKELAFVSGMIRQHRQGRRQTAPPSKRPAGTRTEAACR